MKFNLNKSFEILRNTPFVLEKLFIGLNRDWLICNEGKGTWSPVEILCHLIHCEVDDWIPRMKIILSNNNNKQFKPFNRKEGFENVKEKSINELMTKFRKLRNKNLIYLKSIKLSANYLSKTGIHPEFGEVNLKQLIATWVVHDLSHIAQVSRIMAKQYTAEVGPWIEYLPVLKK